MSRWTEDDFARLRAKRSRLGLQEVVLSEDLPPITLDCSGLTALYLSGKLENRIIAKMESLQKSVADLVTSSSPDSNEPKSRAEQLEKYAELYRWLDEVFACVIVSPKYYKLTELPPGGVPDDGLCFWDIPEEYWWTIANDIVFTDVPTLASFRRLGGSSDSMGSVQGVPSNAVELSSAGRSDVAATDVRRSNASEGEDPRQREEGVTDWTQHTSATASDIAAYRP